MPDSIDSYVVKDKLQIQTDVKDELKQEKTSRWISRGFLNT